nr:MFS transporter [Telmatospirillum siberiense]
MNSSVPKNKNINVLGLALLYIAYCMSYTDRFAMSLSLTHVGKEFSLNPTELGLVLSAFYIGYSLMQLPGGWLADRFGSKFVVITTIGAWSIFTVFTGFAWSFVSLIAIRFIFGIAEGGFPASAVKAVSETFSGEMRPKMTALLISSNYVGSMIAPLIMAPLIIYFGWRHAFTAIGGAGLLFALAYYFAVPYEKPGADGSRDSKPQDWTSLRELLRNPLLYQLLITWFCLSCVNKGLDAWMPAYLLQARGLNLKAVGLLTPLPFVMASISTGLGGWIMIRFFDGREKYLMTVSCILTGVFLYMMYTASTVAGVITYQSILYFFKSFVFATAFSLPAKLLKDNQVGTGIGMVNLGGQVAGFVAPFVMGVLVSEFGTYDAAFQFLLGATVIATLVSLTIRTRPASRTAVQSA